MNPRLSLLLLAAGTLHAAQLEVLPVPGDSLRGNPLGDPVERPVAVFSPDATLPETPLPLVIYLPGWGGSSQQAIAEGPRSPMAQAVDALAAHRHGLRIAVVDGRSRYGGSQFLNSTATGRYADYVAQDVVAGVERRFTVAGGRLLAGHSSGAYGALMLTMAEHEKFRAVVALSPDSDFEVTHRPLVQEGSVKAVTPAELEVGMAAPGKARMPASGLARLVMGLCANYVPDRDRPGRFQWLYDARGAWRPEVWQGWIALDPLTAVRQRPDAFSSAQKVYLDGAEHDEFGANIGARKIAGVLQQHGTSVSFYESPGGHGDHLPERLIRGLEWVFAQER